MLPRPAAAASTATTGSESVKTGRRDRRAHHGKAEQDGSTRIDPCEYAAQQAQTSQRAQGVGRLDDSVPKRIGMRDPPGEADPQRVQGAEQQRPQCQQQRVGPQLRVVRQET